MFYLIISSLLLCFCEGKIKVIFSKPVNLLFFRWWCLDIHSLYRPHIGCEVEHHSQFEDTTGSAHGDWRSGRANTSFIRGGVVWPLCLCKLSWLLVPRHRGVTRRHPMHHRKDQRRPWNDHLDISPRPCFRVWACAVLCFKLCSQPVEYSNNWWFWDENILW